jgi:hypothetical protein
LCNGKNLISTHIAFDSSLEVAQFKGLANSSRSTIVVFLVISSLK